MIGFDESGAISLLEALDGKHGQSPSGVVASADAIYVVGSFVDELRIRKLHASARFEDGTGFIARLAR